MAEGSTVAKKEVVIESVKMDDGTVVDFSGKVKLKKSYEIDQETGKITLRMDFRNGEVRNFIVPEKLLLQFAAHGASQKLGDEIAGTDDVEDMIEGVDALMERLNDGEWTQKRQSSGLAGASTLLKALVKATGKDAAEIRKFLSTKDAGEKKALRDNPKIRPFVDELEAKRKKPEKRQIDTEALLGELA